MRVPYSRRDKILTPEMLKLISSQSLVQVIFLSIILFKGPDLLNIVSSVDIEGWSPYTVTHYSIFFNTFVMFQIFNQFNMRQMQV